MNTAITAALFALSLAITPPPKTPPATPAIIDPVVGAVQHLIAIYPDADRGQCVVAQAWVRQNEMAGRGVSVGLGNEALVTFDADGNVIGVSQRVRDFVEKTP